jgi:hypothetical protein
MRNKMDIVSVIYFLKNRGSGTHSDTKFGLRGGVSYTDVWKEIFLKAVPVCILLRKNLTAFRHVPSQKYLCI